MRDFDKTQEQLITELLQMRQRIAEKNPNDGQPVSHSE